jgi:hypothetical protein
MFHQFKKPYKMIKQEKDPKIYKCFYSANAGSWIVLNDYREEIKFKTIKEALKYMKYGKNEMDS